MGHAASDDVLKDLARRIDRIVLDPDSIDAPFVRLARPILKTIGYSAKVQAKAAKALVALARKSTSHEEMQAALEAAIRELQENVIQVERATVVNRRPLVSHAAWLRRLLSIVGRASRIREDEGAREVLAAIHPVQMLPPLAVRASSNEDGEQTSDDGALADLQLGLVDHLIAAARDESALLGRRQRLLEAARQILLETQAAIPLDPEGLSARQAYIATALTRIDRLRAAGLRPDARLLHQAREALSRGERDRLHAALVAMHNAALEGADMELAHLADRAIHRMWGGKRPTSEAARQHSLRESIQETFGETLPAIVDKAVEEGRKRYSGAPNKLDAEDVFRHEAAKTMLGKDASHCLLTAAMLSNGRFEVGGALSPVQITEHETRSFAVRFPTQDLLLLPAMEPADIADAIIEDPRTVLLDLAAGRLLSRRYVHHETRERKRTILRGEVRVYVLDGSGSMIGHRARVRDAIVLAELSTLLARCQTETASVVLFYRYFNEKVEPVTRVATISEIESAIVDVISTIRTGGTNIREALLRSMDQVRQAKERDPDLARAQIVLVTDGEAPVDEEELAAAREQIGSMPVGLSVIALGEENSALRGIVARQRAKGEHAFYHFIDDGTLEQMASGKLDDVVLHLPKGHTPPSLDEVDILLEEMQALGKKRDTEALETLEAVHAAEADLGLARAAHSSALYKDREMLDRLYARWFPSIANAPPTAPDDDDREDLDAMRVVISAIVEIVSVVGGSPLARKSDALELLERLLPDARLSPARWDELLARWPGVLAPSLATLHATVEPKPE